HRESRRREDRLVSADRLETGRTVDEHRGAAGREEQDDGPPLGRDEPDRIEYGRHDAEEIRQESRVRPDRLHVLEERRHHVADGRNRKQVRREDRHEGQQSARRQRARDDREPLVELDPDLRRQEDAGAAPSESERHFAHSASIERPTIVRNASSRLTGPTVADRCSRSATSMISWTRPGSVITCNEFPSATLWPNEANRSRWFPPFSIETRNVPPICRFAPSAVPSKRMRPSSTMNNRSESASASS